MTTYTARRAYEAAIAYDNEIAHRQQPKDVKLSGLDALAYQTVREACESQLGKPIGKDPETARSLQKTSFPVSGDSGNP